MQIWHWRRFFQKKVLLCGFLPMAGQITEGLIIQLKSNVFCVASIGVILWLLITFALVSSFFSKKGEEFRYISTSMIKLMNTEYNWHNFCLPKSAINKVYWTHVYNFYAQQITTFLISWHRKHSCASNNSDAPEQQRALDFELVVSD